MKKLPGIIIGIVVIAIAYYLISPIWRVVEVNEDLNFPDQTESQRDEILPPVEMNELMPEEMVVADSSKPVATLSGNLLPDAHEVAGSVSIYESNGQRILRFEDFETINGPGLHIYLSTDTEASDYIDLGEIRATKGNVNYEVSSDIDLSSYDHVLIWCEPFGINFSYAVLE